ncbi:unnamed protein product [Mytilus edulis]|uniref:Uncharacterized protein n=1 Tax=Mytilus edulis TaxID=6550 RepID=A0A8S3S229_MYTED|nr:unnamed protein product [Mytilus edulis]
MKISEILLSGICLCIVTGSQAYLLTDTIQDPSNSPVHTHDTQNNVDIPLGNINVIPVQPVDNSIGQSPAMVIDDGVPTGVGTIDDIGFSDENKVSTNEDDIYSSSMIVDRTGLSDDHVDDDKFDASINIGIGMNCSRNGVNYEEGVGIYDDDIPCKMYICEFGSMKPFYSMCYMDGKCYDAGQTWVSDCVQYTCILTNRGFMSQVSGKLCKLERRKGGTKCLKDGESGRTAPCVKRQCKVTKMNDDFITELSLHPEFGGCIRFGKCYGNGQSITTKRCVTRTCRVNELFQKAWFEETERGCKFEGKCLEEGETAVRRCIEFTCTRKVVRNNKTRMVMKKTNKNVCGVKKPDNY